MKDFKPIVWLALLFLADTLFLWMFLASSGFERVSEATSAAHEFAARWRHGMSGGWPLYMPGYFLTTVVLWFWSDERSLQRLLVEGLAVLFLSAFATLLLAPAGTDYLIEAFQRQTGLPSGGASPGPTLVGSLRGIFTLAAWSAFIIAGRRALMRRSLLPLGLPLVLGVVLALVRPVSTFNDMIALWGQRIVQGDGVAIFSFLAIPAAAALFVWHQLRREEIPRRRSVK